jgi:hypothetical protein
MDGSSFYVFYPLFGRRPGTGRPSPVMEGLCQPYVSAVKWLIS